MKIEHFLKDSIQKNSKSLKIPDKFEAASKTRSLVIFSFELQECIGLPKTGRELCKKKNTSLCGMVKKCRKVTVEAKL